MRTGTVGDAVTGGCAIIGCSIIGVGRSIIGGCSNAITSDSTGRTTHPPKPSSYTGAGVVVGGGCVDGAHGGEDKPRPPTVGGNEGGGNPPSGIGMYGCALGFAVPLGTPDHVGLENCHAANQSIGLF